MKVLRIQDIHSIETPSKAFTADIYVYADIYSIHT